MSLLSIREQLHVIFYDDDDKTVSEFDQFLHEKGQVHGDIVRITPTIEDCFIELMKMK
jgi:hypothetical protein